MATRVRETTLETGTGTKQKMGFSMRNDANSPDASNYIVAPAYENHAEFSLYLGRCQVDTPPDLVKSVWQQVTARREKIGKVIDFGAGDGRFALYGEYENYVGYEIDQRRIGGASLPTNAEIRNICAFEEMVSDADVGIGNPPFVRNQDLPLGWAKHASSIIRERTGVQMSGLANAWQYFFMLSLASTKANGLAALVVPYEWVSRPSAKALRQYIQDNSWGVSVYRLCDSTFKRVLTTSTISIVDKRDKSGKWSYFLATPNGTVKATRSPTGSRSAVLAYTRHPESGLRAKRGLSPGTQKALVLTEGERARFGLKRGRDVVPCITSLKPLDYSDTTLDEETFRLRYVTAGKRCWLIRTDLDPSERLLSYLESVPEQERQTATCQGRDLWWAFKLPSPAPILIASGFRGDAPKVVGNGIAAISVGGVCGIYGAQGRRVREVIRKLSTFNFRSRVVAHSKGLMKVEIAQLNTVLATI
ncbi:hypothetical protein SB768_22645 [Burkholderia sp. SIMBA_043]|uniref:Eco57I restriction-modification methylase domain-containing protein n=1 Tax=Burkholderia TaxID=32008 RepID=UPI0011870D77|nr:class I SAM-dependent methyltransferase [Burkholderia vietnamiensis]UBI23923.1 hypothetical protein LA325_08710 [Burkholderia vietnamiensis]